MGARWYCASKAIDCFEAAPPLAYFRKPIHTLTTVSGQDSPFLVVPEQVHEPTPFKTSGQQQALRSLREGTGAQQAVQNCFLDCTRPRVGASSSASRFR